MSQAETEARRIKPSLTERWVSDFLKTTVGLEPAELNEIAEGHVSQAFGFDSDDQALIVRFGGSGDAYHKDDLAHRIASSSAVPVPRVLDIGEWTDGWYAVSERAAGCSLKALSLKRHRGLAPAIVTTLRALGDVTPRNAGYGAWSIEGDGVWSSWSAALLDIDAPADEGFYAGWTRLLASGEIDSALWRRLYKVVEDSVPMLDRTPRRVVHSDFGGDNLIADGDRISAVIDWGNAAYGDTLYDLANLTFWWPQLGFEEEFLHQTGPDDPSRIDFAQRLGVYEAYHALHSLRFFAHMNMRDASVWAQRRALAVLEGLD